MLSFVVVVTVVVLVLVVVGVLICCSYDPNRMFVSNHLYNVAKGINTF